MQFFFFGFICVKMLTIIFYTYRCRWGENVKFHPVINISINAIWELIFNIKIYDLFLNGQGSNEIKNYLEANGYLTATGLKRWSASSIVRILRNPFYSGTIVYRKSYIPDYLEQKTIKNRKILE